MDNLYLALYHSLRIFAKLPICVLKKIGHFIGFLAYHLDKKHRKIVLKNFDICFLDMSEEEKIKTTKNLYKNYGEYIFWYFKLLNMSKDEILNIVEFKNEQILQSSIDKEEKIVFITAHFGMWELLPSAVAMKFGKKIAIVGRDLDSKKMNEVLEKNREKNGIKLISKFGGAKQMIKSLKNGYALGILTDQDCDLREGFVYEINGYKLTQSKIASKIVLKHNAAMIFTYIYKEKDKFVIEFFEKIYQDDSLDEMTNEEILTKKQLEVTSHFWTKYKDEYFWFHKRFKSFHEDEYK